MRRNVKNDKVLRAISIGLATMIAVSSTPVNVYAEGGESGTTNNAGSTTTSTNENAKLAAVESATETAASSAETLNNSVKSSENETVPGISGKDDTTQEKVAGLNDITPATAPPIVINTIIQKNPESTGGAQAADVVTASNPAIVPVVTEKDGVISSEYTLPTENIDAVAGIKQDAKDLEVLVNTVEGNVATQVGKANSDVKDIKNDIAEMKKADSAAYEAAGHANDAADAMDLEDKTSNADLIQEVEDAARSVSQAIVDVRSAGTIENVNIIVNGATQKANQAKEDYERKERAAAAAQKACSDAQDELDIAENNYNQKLSDAKSKKKDALKELKEAEKQLREARNKARDLKEKAQAAKEAADEAATGAGEASSVVLQAATDAKAAADDFVADTRELRTATKTISDYEKDQKTVSKYEGYKAAVEKFEGYQKTVSKYEGYKKTVEDYEKDQKTVEDYQQDQKTVEDYQQDQKTVADYEKDQGTVTNYESELSSLNKLKNMLKPSVGYAEAIIKYYYEFESSNADKKEITYMEWDSNDDNTHTQAVVYLADQDEPVYVWVEYNEETEKFIVHDTDGQHQWGDKYVYDWDELRRDIERDINDGDISLTRREGEYNTAKANVKNNENAYNTAKANVKNNENAYNTAKANVKNNENAYNTASANVRNNENAYNTADAFVKNKKNTDRYNTAYERINDETRKSSYESAKSKYDDPTRKSQYEAALANVANKLGEYEEAKNKRTEFASKYKTGLSDCETSAQEYTFARDLYQKAKDERSEAKTNLAEISKTIKGYNASYQNHAKLYSQIRKAAKEEYIALNDLKNKVKTLREQIKSIDLDLIKDSEGVAAAKEALGILQKKYSAAQEALADASETYSMLDGMVRELNTVSAGRIAEIRAMEDDDDDYGYDDGGDDTVSGTPGVYSGLPGAADVITLTPVGGFDEGTTGGNGRGGRRGGAGAQDRGVAGVRVEDNNDAGKNTTNTVAIKNTNDDSKDSNEQKLTKVETPEKPLAATPFKEDPVNPAIVGISIASLLAVLSGLYYKFNRRKKAKAEEMKKYKKN